MTFKSCVHAIDFWHPDAFILENVDMSEDSESESGNLDIILKTLQSKNYTVKCFKVISTDYGLPTRRVRLYLGGFSNRKQPNASFALVEQLLCLCKLKHQPPDSWISCSDEPTELQSFGS